VDHLNYYEVLTQVRLRHRTAQLMRRHFFKRTKI